MSSVSVVPRNEVIPTSSNRSMCTGELYLLDPRTENSLAARQIYSDQELIVGRDIKKCHWVFDDLQLSAKHLRIYTITFENEEDTISLVYAEDLSRNGTYWNKALIGKGNGGFLLSHNDQLRLSPRITFRFISSNRTTVPKHFNTVQEMEMEYFRKEYVITDRLLGTGSFGRVFMSIEQHTRTQVACKVIDLRSVRQITSRHFNSSKTSPRVQHIGQNFRTNEPGFYAMLQREKKQAEEQIKICCREVEILSRISHPNIIGINKVYMTDNTIYMFQDLITAGDLFAYMESCNGKLPEVEVAVIIRQVILALQFLHDQNIVHRDLKPENIMMTSLSAGCRVVLTDFGASRRLRSFERMTSLVGTEQYAAPEINPTAGNRTDARVGYTKAVDMWSVGTITFALLTGSFAFSDQTTGVYSPVLARRCDLASLEQTTEYRQISPRPKSFISKLLILDEQQRMTASEALRHGWFANEIHKIDFEQLYRRTIKNWRSSLPCGPIVEVIKPCDFQHFIPSHLVAKTSDRIGGAKPTKFPYKPFPRNAYIHLWPKRKASCWSMPEEANTVIAGKWAHSSRSEILQANGDPKCHEYSMDNGLGTTLQIRSENQSVTATVNAHRGVHRIILRPCESSKFFSTVKSLPIMMDKVSESTKVKRSEAPETEPEPTCTQNAVASITSLPPFPSPPANRHSNFKKPSLRRQTNMTDAISTRKRGWRNSTFDIAEVKEDGPSYQNASHSTTEARKRTKLST